MNHPLDHRGYTFYQSSYIRMRDPHTGQSTGQFQSVFQVATNPGRPIIYGGCLLVVLGAFLQFYMRAGIFTDGGKQERERAARSPPRKKAELAHARSKSSRWPCTIRQNHEQVIAGRALGEPNMRRIGKLLGGLALAGMLAAVLPARASRRRQVAGHRPGLRADRQGGRDARRARQAARHRRPRGGQAGLRPRDDQAARPARRGREDPRPRGLRRQGRHRVAGRKWGPVGAFIGWTISPEFWDDQPFILVDYLPLRRRIVADTLATAAQGDRRQVDDPRRRKGHAARSSRPTRKSTSAALTAFLRGSKLPVEDRKTIAELAAKLSEEHKWLTPRELEEAQITDKDHDASRSWTGPASSRSSSGNSMPIRSRPRGSPRSRSGRSRSPCGSRPTRLTAESGSRPPVSS